MSVKSSVTVPDGSSKAARCYRVRLVRRLCGTADAELRSVVLVEGKSDGAAVEALAGRLGHELDAEGVSNVPMDGDGNAGRFLERYGPRGSVSVSPASTTRPKSATSGGRSSKSASGQTSRRSASTRARPT
jgi:hypothetical protein